MGLLLDIANSSAIVPLFATGGPPRTPYPGPPSFMDPGFVVHHAGSWDSVLALTGMLPMAEAADGGESENRDWLAAVSGTARLSPVPVVAQIWGPLTIAAQLRGAGDLMRGLLVGSPAADELIGEGLERSSALADEALRAGADVLWVAEPVSALLDSRSFERYAVGPLRAVRAIATAGGRDAVLHASGRVGHLLGAVARLSFEGLSITGGPTALEASRALPKGGVILAGPLSARLTDTPAATLSGEVARICREMRGRPFIATLGSAVPDDAPVDVIADIARTVRMDPGLAALG